MKTTTLEQSLLERILYIGTEIPESMMKDTRPKFIVLGTPQEFIDENSNVESIEKDFYNDLPGMVCVELDNIIKKYRKEKWFHQAWEEYRGHVTSTGMDEVKMPGFVFKKYIK